MPEPDWTMLVRLIESTNAEQRRMRADLRNLATVLTGVTEALTRLSGRIEEQARQTSKQISDTRDDLVLVLKGEMGGQFANLETRLEQRIDADLADLTAQIEDLKRKIP